MKKIEDYEKEIRLQVPGVVFHGDECLIVTPKEKRFIGWFSVLCDKIDRGEKIENKKVLR